MDPTCQLCEKAKKPHSIYLENVHNRLDLTNYSLAHGKLGKVIDKNKLLKVSVWNEWRNISELLECQLCDL
jgi:hypothetical protein